MRDSDKAYQTFICSLGEKFKLHLVYLLSQFRQFMAFLSLFEGVISDLDRQFYSVLASII
jgi:hypothetical protein